MLDWNSLSILVCPKCKGQLEHRHKPEELVCQACRLDFEIREDIPILLLEEARKF
jgi:uncharacterized protein